jgi:hypothetical protein
MTYPPAVMKIVDRTSITKLIRGNCRTIEVGSPEPSDKVTGTLLINGSIIKYLIITIVSITIIKFCHLIS